MLAASAGLFYLVCRDDRVAGAGDIHLSVLMKEANPLAAFLAGRKIMTPLFVAIFTVAALSNLGSTSFDQSFNYYLKAQLGLTSGYNGAIKAVIGLVSLTANGTIGLWLINRTDVRWSSVWVYLLCSLSMLGVVFLSSTVPFVAVNVLYFGLFSMSVPLTQSLVASRARREDSNLIFGYYNGLKSVGGIFGALFAGLLYTKNPKLPFMLGFAAFLMATLASAYYCRVTAAEREPGQDTPGA
jgi:DHA1 family multidrug resistance protein-like MFS transporter